MSRLEEWVSSVNDLGPFKTHPDGTLYVYCKPEEADQGEAAGIFVPAEDLVRRRLTAEHGPTGWTQQARNEALGFLKDSSAPVFSEINEPLIPCLSGVVDLSDPTKVQVMDHTPFLGFTAQVPWLYDPGATCPNIERFLLEACGGDREMVDFIYEVIGYSLLPFQFLRKAVMLTGASGTGKSTVLYLVEHLVGQGNAAYVPLQSLGEDRFATSDLFGKLVNIGGDIDATEIKATGVFKSLTGDDYVRADVKYGKPIRFRSGATCWFAANEPPASRDHTDAWRGRWVILPFDCKPERADYMLKSKITTQSEMEGLFRHAVEGAAALLARGRLVVPAKVEAAHRKFVETTDHLQGFLCHAEAQFSGVREKGQVLASYQAWCQGEGIKPVRRQVLMQRAGERWSENGTSFNIPSSKVLS